MNLHFKGMNYDVSGEAQALFERKFNAVRKFTKSAGEVKTDVYVELGKVSEAHQNGKIWRAEVNFDSNGVQHRAVAVEESLDNAIDAVIGQLSRELSTAKTRKQSLVKRGGAAVKSMLRGFK